MAGRFAPSPTGPLHAGSLATALASWLEARSRGRPWRLRIEDLDPPRESPEAAAMIQRQLQAHGLVWDAISFQSDHGPRYAQALTELSAMGLAYACGCSRRRLHDDLEAGLTVRLPGGEIRYPGHCRPQAAQPAVASALWGGAGAMITERPGGSSSRFWSAGGQDDFVLLRADGHWAYHLAVVVDDAAEGIDHIVRGSDLADCLPRHRALQRALGLAEPEVLHVPVVCNGEGEKLSKQTLAPAIADRPSAEAQAELDQAWEHLVRSLPEDRVQRWSGPWQALWAETRS